MAWVAPPTWAVAEIVTAARMQILSDDLSYLKGNAGAVVIGDTVQTTGLGVSVAPSASYVAYLKSGALPLRIEQSGNSTDFIDFYNSLASNRWGIRLRDLAEGDFGIRDVTAGVYRQYFNAAGNVGFGTTTPQGKVHGYDTISGFLHWKYDGVDGTARTVVPDGTGDVLYLLGGMGVTRTSGGATAATSFLGASAIAPGGAQVLYSAGGDTCALQVAANGAITVQRTAGALTYKVGLWLLWL